ncbi:hypothetical protein [Photobacterium leiognathi]|uniref:hypothetical protein n=1 Tax=Photobacterium leiognathi TaxID=553611 RepID=UPI0029824A37|nr:hypothetical protein [Photobacterium leiognathi]
MLEQLLDDNRSVTSDSECSELTTSQCYCNCHNAEIIETRINNGTDILGTTDLTCDITNANLIMSNCDGIELTFTAPTEPEKPNPVSAPVKCQRTTTHCPAYSSSNGLRYTFEWWVPLPYLEDKCDRPQLWDSDCNVEMIWDGKKINLNHKFDWKFYKNIINSGKWDTNFFTNISIPISTGSIQSGNYKVTNFSGQTTSTNGGIKAVTEKYSICGPKTEEMTFVNQCPVGWTKI